MTPRQSRVGRLASKRTRSEFAEELSSLTRLSSKELEQLFPKVADRKELVELMRIVEKDVEEKEQRAEIVERISQFSGAVVRMARHFAPGL